MKWYKTSLFLLLLVSSNVSAQDIKSFQVQVVIAIKGNDIALIRDNALKTLKNMLLDLALGDLIGKNLFAEYKTTILEHGKILPDKFITSIEILQEESQGSKFSMSLQGTVQMKWLREVLETQQLIFKDDPYRNITLVIEKGITLPLNELKTRLHLFHLIVKGVHYYHPTAYGNVSFKQHSREQKLFALYPANNFILYAQAITTSSQDLIKGIEFRIIRKADFKLLSQITWGLGRSIKRVNLAASLRRKLKKNLTRFSLYSLKIVDYERANREEYLLHIRGINIPYRQFVFEKKILALNRKIKSFQIVGLSKSTVTYKIQAKADLSELKKFFTRNKRHFNFTLSKEEPTKSSINLSASWNTPIKATEVVKWNHDPEIIQRIKKIISPGAKTLSPKWIPAYTETEPNNRSHEVNVLPENHLLIGRISSRSDADIFRLSRSSNKSVISVRWIQLGKTSLTPQLKLYDKNFRLLNSYQLSRSRKTVRIKYRLNKIPAGEIFIKVGDKLGFIRNETGGYKSYFYLLKFNWKK